jgi:hypothetical protein
VRHEEYDIQVALCRWCDSVAVLGGDVARYIASANEGKRDIRAAARLKRQGVRAGIPDLFWPAPRGDHAGLWIELKRPGGRLTDSQIDWLEYLNDRGYDARVCYGLQEAIDVVAAYFEIRLVRN